MRAIMGSRARVLLYCAVPALAIVVATRQAYLNAFYGLSTWKGGGMGMFAGADSGDTRFTRIFIELPNGQRQPVLRLLGKQEVLLDRALLYPTDANFRKLGTSLRRTSFIAADKLAPVNRADMKGEPLEPTGQSYYLLYANAPRPEGDEPDWAAIIEYWTISFDPQTRMARATLQKTMRFGREGG